MNATSEAAAVMNISYPYERPWIRDEIFVASLTAISFYLTVALSIFEYKHSHQKESKESNWKTKVENFLSSGTLCLVAVIFTLIRCLCEQIELRLGRVSDIACRFYQHELPEIYHLALTSLYLILWTRQLKLYRHRALRHLSSPLLRFFSYTVLLGIIGSSLASLISYLVTFSLIASPAGCVYDLSFFIDGPPSSLPGILLFVIAVVFQFSLLGLMVFPLVKQYEVHLCGETSEKAKKHQNVRKTIVRLTICTTICVISDGISSSLLVFVYDGISPLSFWANIYTLNLLANIVLVVCSFADWRKRLFPCLKKEYSSVANTSASGGTSV